MLESTAPVDDAAARRGDEPWASNERHSAPPRDITRKATLEALGQPWSSFCTEEGANRLVASLNHHYWRDERVDRQALRIKKGPGRLSHRGLAA